MFQVPAHPTSFNMHGHGHQQAFAPPPQSPSVQLPRTLSRPHFMEVSRDAILAAAPELGDVPAEYIRRGLRSRANEMLGGISSLAPSHMPSSMPKSHLPASLSIPIRASSSQPSYPTHVIAVSSSKSSSSDSLMMFPVHSLVLASQCSALPRLPGPAVQTTSMLQVPVLPLSLPSPAAFHILHAFMYDHRLDSVLRALFPLPSGFLQSISHQAVQSTLASGNSLHQLSMYLCSSAASNLHTLTTHAAHVKELWQDMVALGLYDPELWDTIDLAWEITLGALNLAATGH